MSNLACIIELYCLSAMTSLAHNHSANATLVIAINLSKIDFFNEED